MAETRAHPLPLDAYPLKAFDTIRFGDTDKIGHVNNAAFASYFETGRAMLLSQAACGPIAPEGHSLVLARLVVDFRAEMRWPGRADIGSRISAIGRSSMTLAQAVFQDGVCTATGESVVVLMNLATRRSAPFPESSLERLRSYLG